MGFHPPIPSVAHGWYLVLAYIELIIFLCVLILVQCLRQQKLRYLAVAAILIPICFVATQDMSLVDYAYVFSPAYRLINHFKLKEIYFQYDLLMPILAAGWMKLGLNLTDFQIVPRISIYLFLAAAFIYANRVFKKPLAYLLLVSLILLKIYAIFNYDLAASIQLTPLRLDLWLVLLIIAAEKGVYSKLLGVCLGLMNIVHHSFGLFYTLSYLEVCIVLIALDYKDHVWKNTMTLRGLLKKHVILILPNTVLISPGLLCYFLLFNCSETEGTALYKTLGIGFLRVSNVSFYWYVFALLCMTFALLIQRRKQLPLNYVSSGIFLIFLVVGNSLYFFGRSHEANIINTSGSSVVALFLFFDLLNRRNTSGYFKTLQSKFKKIILSALPIFFIFIVTYFYSERITTIVNYQAGSIFLGRFSYRMSNEMFQFKNITKSQFESMIFNTDELKLITHNSQKIFVLSYMYDFYYYYYGKYIPRAHFTPYYAWPYKNELVRYLQKLLDDGFYLVIPERAVVKSNETLADWEVDGHREILSGLTYEHNFEKNGFKLVWK